MSGRLRFQRSRLFITWLALSACVLGLTLRSRLVAESAPAEMLSELPISISADYASEAKGDDGQRVLILRGHCRLVQGETLATAQQMVLWITPQATSEQVAAYLEGNVQVEQVGQSDQQPNAYLQIGTRPGGITTSFRFNSPATRLEDDSLFQRGTARRKNVQRKTLTQTQFVVPTQEPTLPGLRLSPSMDNQRRIRVAPRNATPINIQSEKSDATVPPEQITILTGGVRLVIEGDERFDVVDLSADRVVIWAELNEADQFSDLLQPKEAQFQVYLEGNIVARQGIHVMRAERAFYDAREQRGLLLDAELSVKPPELGGHRIRVRAERLRQNSKNEFHASNAWTTTSQFGKPGYRIQSSDIFVEPYYAEPLELPRLGGDFDSSRFDPVTGAPVYRETPFITALNNSVIIDEVPLLYVPWLAGPVEDPGIPINGLTVNSDRVFGVQLRTSWDLMQILGLEKTPGTELDWQVDYLSQRGPATGLNGKYLTHDLFGVPGTAIGEGLGYYIHDDGFDNLGRDRRHLDPPNNNRGRINWRHQHELPDGFKLQAELGYLSDRNFLEQFYENEFDTGKDIETLASLTQTFDNAQWGLLVRPQLFGFENNTQWLPRGDVTILGEPLLGGWLSWSSHSMAAYAQLHQANAPANPSDLFSPLPYYTNADGAVVMTRHELSAPLNFGPFNLVPYAWGEASGWTDSFTDNDIGRLVGSAGVRGSIMFTKIMPWVQSRIFNLNGLAHKMTFDVDWSITESNRALSTIPQWNEFDDNSQERFRQRLLMNTYSGVLPTSADPRNFAVRSGAGSSVTAPWHELVDDLHVVRLGWRHRLQTKVGPPEQLRVRDWMTLDLEASFFPNSLRDNFGEDFGLFGARYAWHVGERTSLLANAAYDFFGSGMELWNVGILNQRSTRGSLYAGIRQVKGEGFASRIFTASASYAMSDKWITTIGTAYDLAENQNRGQSFTITRVGADFLFHLGANFDASKNNAGIAFSVEPRLGPLNAQSTQLSNLLGVRR